MIRIIPRVFGGIGNQLFCYAAARRLALVNNAELVIDNVSGFVRDVDYQRQYQLDHFSIPCRKATPAERLEPFSRIRRKLLREIDLRRPFMKRRYIQQEGMDFDARLLEYKPKGTARLEGYWQSERYFKDVEDVIRQDLRIKHPTDAANLEMVKRIRGCLAVALHVRFFDTQGERCINNPPGDYYARAVGQMETFAPQAHYFVFSDRPDAARARIPLPDARITCVSNNRGDSNAYADLWLMTLCRHYIIANSTFSWWAAWLGSSDGKIVIAPLKNLTGNSAWGFEGVIPASWYSI